MHTSVDEVTAEQPPDALGGAGEAVRAGGEAEVVQAHAGIVRHDLVRSGQGGRVFLMSRIPWPPCQAGSAGCSASRSRAARWRSQWVTSSSYAGRPMSSTSSGSFVT